MENQNKKSTAFSLDDAGRLIISDANLLRDISGGKSGSLNYQGIKLNEIPIADCGCGGGKGNSGCCNGACK